MTVLSVVAQILMTRKYVENWILWVVINIISIGIYAAQGVYAMSLEYLILLFIAANGTRLWVIAAKRQPQGGVSHDAATPSPVPPRPDCRAGGTVRRPGPGRPYRQPARTV